MNDYDLWRIDVTHESGGCFCQFRRHKSEAETLAFTLRQCGWNVATRPATGLHLVEAEEARLRNGVWPPVDNREVLAALRNEQGRLRKQLREAIQRQDIKRKTPKYGTTRS